MAKHLILVHTTSSLEVVRQSDFLCAFLCADVYFVIRVAQIQFLTYCHCEEVVAKISAYSGVAMYALRELEDAIDDCLSGDTKRNADSVQALDEAVAFYTGSLEGTDGSGSGVFPYSLAEKRCVDFKTCGATGDQISGKAKVNMNIFSHFSQMKVNIAKKDCTAARLDKEAIAKQLFVPIIQGTLRYAYKQAQPDTNVKAEAEGAAFAAAVLPVVAACNSESAATIFEEMKPNSGNTANFESVRSAFERTYDCMGISCADVGGIYDSATSKYFDGAAPCGSSSSKGSKTGLAIGLTIGGIVVVALLAMFLRRQGKSSVEFKSSSTSQV
jgi:Low iron-inducible periplasmic protein